MYIHIDMLAFARVNNMLSAFYSRHIAFDAYRLRIAGRFQWPRAFCIFIL